MQFQDYLKSRSAHPPMVEWVSDRTLEKAWTECERADWMLWLAAKVRVDHKLIVLAACDCAQTAAKYCYGDTLAAVMRCDRVTREWCEGQADLEKVQKARRDVSAFSECPSEATLGADTACAYATAACTAAAATINPSYDALATVYAVASAATSYLAKDVTDIGVYIAAHKAAHLECCRLIRERIPLALVVAAKEEN